MQLEVVARKENPLLKRVEVRFKAIHKAEPTPTRDALRAFLAKELKATKDVVVIDHQASTFGRYETLGYAKIYKSKEEAVSIERRHILVRNRLVEAEAKEKEGAPPKPEKPAPTPPAEKPAPTPKPEAPKAEPKAEKAVAKAEKKPAEKKEAAEKKEERKPPKKEEKAEAKKPGSKKKEAS
jgi:small subunit ribosomal protein S24e